MSLPKPTSAVFNTTIKEINKKFKFRQFLMKDERSLQLAKAIGDDESIRNTLESVVESCVLDDTFVAADSPAFLVDYLYIQMHIKSHEDVIPVNFTCEQSITTKEKVKTIDENGNDIEEEVEVIRPCGHVSKNFLDLKQVKIDFHEKYNEMKAIKVSETITLNMKDVKSSSMRDFYIANEIDPSTGDFAKSLEDRFEANGNLIFESIENISTLQGTDENGEKIEKIDLPNVDFDKKEFFEWLDELPKNVTESLREYFENVPNIKLTSKMQCMNPDCLHSEEYNVVGAKTFLELS